jgi:NAD-dependent DNA ligase
MCNCNRQFQITGYSVIQYPCFPHRVVSISGTGLVTANSVTHTFTQTNAAGTSAASSDIVVNAQPATPHQHQQQEQLHNQHTVTATGSFQKQVIAHSIPMLSHQV